MKLFYAWFALALLYRDAAGEPKPNFGVNSFLAGSVQVGTISGDASDHLTLIASQNVTLASHYKRLYNLRTALLSVGEKISTKGALVTSKLDALAAGIALETSLMSSAKAAIDALHLLLQTDLGTLKNDIRVMVGSYINDMLNDASDQLLDTLDSLTAQLVLIDNGIVAATTDYESINVPDAVLRRYVSPRVMFELLRAFNDFKTDLPLVTYIIRLVFTHLSTADDYIAELISSVTDEMYVTSQQYDVLKQEVLVAVSAKKEAIVTPLLNMYNLQARTLRPINRDLAAMLTYDTDLKPVLDAYGSLIDGTTQDKLYNDIDTYYGDYLAKVVQLDDHLDQFYDAKLCAPVQAILQVLIASGPWAEYCYFKYSPDVLGQVEMTTNYYLMCYEIEAARLYNLVELIDRLVVQLLYDVENLAKHLFECFYRIEAAEDCISLIALYYLDLAGNLKLKVDDIMLVLSYELDASYNRMAACVNGGKCGLIASLETLVRDIQACELAGPNA